MEEAIHELRLGIHRLLELLPTTEGGREQELDEQVSKDAHLEWKLLLVHPQQSSVEGEEGPFWRIYKSDGNAGSKYVWIAFFEAALAAELITRCMFLDLRLGEKRECRNAPAQIGGTFGSLWRG